MTRLVPFLCLAFFASLAGPAYASNDSHEARVLYQKGSLAFKNGDDVLARDYYQKSLNLEGSFETTCNLARTEARMELFAEAYEHVSMCLYLFPNDPELREAKEKYGGLRDSLRSELTYEEAYPIAQKVEKEIERRENEASAAQVAPSPAPAKDGAVEEVPPGSARIPVTIGIASLGVVGVGAGFVLMSVSASHKKQAGELGEEIEEDSSGPENSACTDPATDARCRELTEHIEKANSNQNAAVASFAIGGSLLLGAAVTYFLWPAPKARAVAMRPSVEVSGSGGWTLGIVGEF